MKNIAFKYEKTVRSPLYERVGSDTLVGPGEQEGGEKYVFLMDKRVDFSDPVMAHEVFLNEIAPNHQWYYGGNRYLPKDQHNYGLVITDHTAATMFMLSEHVR